MEQRLDERAKPGTVPTLWLVFFFWLKEPPIAFRQQQLSGALTEEHLDAALSTPPTAVSALMARLPGDILILGAAGKMGLTLCRMAREAVRQAGVKKRILAVSRFSNPDAREALADRGIETLRADLLDPDAVAGLPDAPNILFLAGRKFGTDGDEPLTWASNVFLPGLVAHRYRESRIVAFSTGCVYPLVESQGGGCTEDTPPGPVGEYAESCLGRERLFQYASAQFGTPVLLYRLNYAIDLRYGVLHDLATRIQAEEPVERTVPTFNCIWQGTANAMALLCLEKTDRPAAVLNVTGRETHRTESAAGALAKHLGKAVRFSGPPGEKAYLSDASRAWDHFPLATPTFAEMLEWTAAWVGKGLPSLGKPTHFEVNDGKF